MPLEFFGIVFGQNVGFDWIRPSTFTFVYILNTVFVVVVVIGRLTQRFGDAKQQQQSKANTLYREKSAVFISINHKIAEKMMHEFSPILRILF